MPPLPRDAELLPLFSTCSDLHLATKGCSANLLKPASKRKRRKADIEQLESQAENAFRDRLSQEVERQTKNLRNQLAQREQESQNNQNAASILSQFINSGDAQINEHGEVVLTPNRIKNEESSLMM